MNDETGKDGIMKVTNETPTSGEAIWNAERTSFHWNAKTIYHGTDVSGIEKFEFADESTIGKNAIYFTVDRSLAEGYAQLRGRERSSSTPTLYEVVIEDIDIMNWAENEAVEVLKQKFKDYCQILLDTLKSSDFEDFALAHDLPNTVTQRLAQLALERIIERCNEKSTHRGSIKTIAQGVLGIFFEEFVKASGYDGVITIEGGDDASFTVKPGISVVIYNREKITSQREIKISSESRSSVGGMK